MSKNCSWILFLIRVISTAAFRQNYRTLTTITPTVYKHGTQTEVYATFFQKLPVSNCSIVIKRGFLRTQCTINNHQYYKCVHSNHFYKVNNWQCDSSTFTRICPNDGFYQACGSHNECKKVKIRPAQIFDLAFESDLKDYLTCGIPMCQSEISYKIPLSNHYRHEAFTPTMEVWAANRCNNITDCKNKINGVAIDEYGCKDNESYWCSNSFSVRISKEQICNDICECLECDDEAHCHNLTLGITCMGTTFYSDEGSLTYVRPHKICDGKKDCTSGEDEYDCNIGTDLPSSCKANLLYSHNPFSDNSSRILNSRSRCSVPNINRLFRVCLSFEDQLNCSFSTFSPLICRVGGYPTTISEHMICFSLKWDGKICDSGIEKSCVEAEPKCNIHKHRLCDEKIDCAYGTDERKLFCADLVVHDQTECVRRWSYNKTALSFPRSWVLDGISDCVNDIDEDSSAWIKECGHGLFEHYIVASQNINSSKSCSSSVQLRCPGSLQTIHIKRVCNSEKKLNCDFLVCRVSRRQASAFVMTTAFTLKNRGNTPVIPRLFYCLPGLENIELKLGVCEVIQIDHQQTVVGVDKIRVMMPLKYASSFLDCSTLYGEIYVFVACTKGCQNGAICPINPATSSKTCNFVESGTLAYGLNENNKLARIIKTRQSFSTAVFSCNSGICIPFQKVCDLVDDCKDGSDEENCVNNFKCNKSGEYIPLSRRCDGQFDCFDFTDECNEDCSTHIRMYKHHSLFVIALIFGLLSTILNTMALFHGIYMYPSIKTEAGLVNRSFVLLITTGDLLQGIFLLASSINDKFFNSSTCTTQFKWTTSSLCDILGVISTIGAQLSLYSMTILSLIRAKRIQSISAPAEGMSRNKALALTLTSLCIIFVSTSVAIIPLLGIFNFMDYFVHNLTFDGNSLFVGKLGKNQLMAVLNTYYGRLATGIGKDEMTWKSIRNLVKGMFTNGAVQGSDISFYGSNGFCLFSYFVKTTIQFRWYSIAVLTTNLLCVLTIGGCYVYVNATALKTKSAIKSANKDATRDSRRLQRKVTLIITTDVLTWLPFIVVCFINYMEWIDTSGWYFVFSIFFLPINSLVNPIGIYDDIVYECAAVTGGFIKARFSCFMNRVRQLQSKEEIEMNEITQSD